MGSLCVKTELVPLNAHSTSKESSGDSSDILAAPFMTQKWYLMQAVARSA